jgi:LmbE family N-acetylglucosaminyl deacetylase
MTMLVQLAELLTSRHRNGLVVSAHPGDETIGAAGLMTRLERCHVFYITDGAPHDRRMWYTSGARTRGDYARIRRDERVRALALAGLEPRCSSSLGVADMEATRALTAIAQRVSNLMLLLRPDFVVTHAYEGGHPDHDAASLGVWAATHLVARQGVEPPPIIEMALYHGSPGYPVMGELMSWPGAVELELALSDDERWRKQAMFDCYGSQALALAPFRELTVERYRFAPTYDFTRAPHDGPLLYEQHELDITGIEWREQAIHAQRVLTLTSGSAAGASPDLARSRRPRRGRMDTSPDTKPGKGWSDEAQA